MAEPFFEGNRLYTCLFRSSVHFSVLKALGEEFTLTETLMFLAIFMSYFHKAKHTTDILIPNWNNHPLFCIM